jgi:hypothetical protein
LAVRISDVVPPVDDGKVVRGGWSRHGKQERKRSKNSSHGEIQKQEKPGATGREGNDAT